MKRQIIFGIVVLMILAFGQAPKTFGQSGGNFTILQSAVSNGGGNVSGGTFSIGNTIGQALAGQPMTGANFYISSGFWAADALNCSYSLSPQNASIASAGGAGMIAVTTATGCAWTASTTDNWISIIGGASGSGNGTNSYSVAANAGQQRVGTVTIGGQTFTITQNGTNSNCITVSLPTNVFASSGATVVIPINVGDLTGKNVDAYDFSIFYNSAILQPASTAFDKAGTLSSDFSVVANSPTAGKLVVSSAGVNLIIGQGMLLNLRFNVIGQSGQQTSLTFINPATNQNTFTFVDGEPAAATNVGQFTVTGPTATGATVSGKVEIPMAGNIYRKTVTLTDRQDATRSAMINKLGYFQFDDVTTGETYVVSVSAKRYTFAPQVLTVTEDVTNLIFTSTP